MGLMYEDETYAIKGAVFEVYKTMFMLNQSYVMTTWIRPLVRDGRLLRTEPQSPKSPFQRFVRA